MKNDVYNIINQILKESDLSHFDRGVRSTKVYQKIANSKLPGSLINKRSDQRVAAIEKIYGKTNYKGDLIKPGTEGKESSEWFNKGRDHYLNKEPVSPEIAATRSVAGIKDPVVDRGPAGIKRSKSIEHQLDIAKANQRKLNILKDRMNKTYASIPDVPSQKVLDDIQSQLKNHQPPAIVQKSKMSTNKKLALAGLGITAAGVGTAAYLKHRRDKKKQEQEKKND